MSDVEKHLTELGEAIGMFEAELIRDLIDARIAAALERDREGAVPPGYRETLAKLREVLGDESVDELVAKLKRDREGGAEKTRPRDGFVEIDGKREWFHEDVPASAPADDELLPCPFCKQQALYHDEEMRAVVGKSEAYCTNEDCRASISRGLGEVDKVIASWNRQAQPAPRLVGVLGVEELAELLQASPTSPSLRALAERLKQARSTALDQAVAERVDARDDWPPRNLDESADYQRGFECGWDAFRDRLLAGTGGSDASV